MRPCIDLTRWTWALLLPHNRWLVLLRRKLNFFSGDIFWLPSCEQLSYCLLRKYISSFLFMKTSFLTKKVIFWWLTRSRRKINLFLKEENIFSSRRKHFLGSRQEDEAMFRVLHERQICSLHLKKCSLSTSGRTEEKESFSSTIFLFFSSCLWSYVRRHGKVSLRSWQRGS